MIYFSGDTHGDIDLLKIFKLEHLVRPTRKDILIILGDCGVLFYKDKARYQALIELYESTGFTILYVDGNHENFPLIEACPIVEIFGAKANKVSDHIYRIRRGEIMAIQGHTFLCIGGANSMDKQWRIKGESYWDEEHITEEDIANALANAAKYGNKVDFILTHCVDSTAVQFGLGYAIDADTNKLSEIDYKIDYKCWLCGHYHCDRFLSMKKLVLYNDIMRLDEESDILISQVSL